MSAKPIKALVLAAALAFASPAPAAASGPFAWTQHMSNRSRMIQVSIVCVIIGICFLYKK